MHVFAKINEPVREYFCSDYLKSSGKYKVIKTIGCSKNEQKIQKLVYLGKQEIERLNPQPKLFVSEIDTLIDEYFHP
jgi:hypothetical protein